MSRPRHPNKHIEAAVKYAERLGWRWEHSEGHPWGTLLCPFRDRKGCQLSVWSTPANPQNHAPNLIRAIDSCVCTAPSQQKTSDERKDQAASKGEDKRGSGGKSP